jgi:hypothetical protein
LLNGTVIKFWLKAELAKNNAEINKKEVSEILNKSFQPLAA